MARVPEGYSACWTPIESNPDIFTKLAQNIGLSKDLAFQDIWALDTESTAFVPRPVYALVLVFPTDEDYEKDKVLRTTAEHSSENNKIIWFQQTIYNACGLYGLLHAVCNGAREHILPNTFLSDILSSYSRTQPSERSKMLASTNLKREYLKAAQDGDSIVPTDAADEVDFHYTCFVKFDSHLYELDGDLSGPIDLGALNENDDILSENALEPIKRFMQTNGRSKLGFSMLALVPKVEN